MATTQKKTKKTPKDLRGSWAGAFPPDTDIQAILREIRSEWEKEWAIGPDGKLEFVEGRIKSRPRKRKARQS